MAITSMRRLLTTFVIGFAILCGGCSFSTDYVIVNASNAPAQVTYIIAPTSIDPLLATGINLPAMLPVAELSGREWRKLSPTEFVLDRVTRTVNVTLPPNQALLINQGGTYQATPPVAEKFIIEEIRIVGPNGQIVWKGDAVKKAFLVVPKPFYSFGPPTLLKLTYA
jgi:hypothetical protein